MLMWIRLRFDIGWRDLASALVYCLTPMKRSVAVERAKQSWSRRNDVLISLSVRSAFDLLLRALQLPQGSEVLLSALTVPDMVRIVHLHGLVPVPVDTDAAGNIETGSLRQAITPRSRLVVVAHLFGGKAPLDGVFDLAKEHNLLVIEDCAQSFCVTGDGGHPASDVALFSFGPIKTATALGGAVARVKSAELRERMAVLLSADPIQSRAAFLTRLVRFAFIKLLTGRRVAALVEYGVERLGGDFDSLANSIVRGFAPSDLLTQLRRQPAVPLLRLLERRWRTYDFGRIENRVALGRLLDGRIGHARAVAHSFWVYPIFVHDPITVRNRLRAAGFDATCRARMTVVPASDKSRTAPLADRSWKQVLFLPWYPDMPREAVEEMSALIQTSDIRYGSAAEFPAEQMASKKMRPEGEDW